MTDRATEIQTLIADIDSLLAHKNRRLPMAFANPGQPRQVLERIRSFLVSVAPRSDEHSTDNIQQPQQQIPTESSLLTPLQAELQTLLQQRATLVQEIRQLEQRRLHNYSLAQQMANQEKIISEFLQVLMTRLTPIAPQPGNAIASTQLTTDAPRSAIINNATEPWRLHEPDVERFTRLTMELDQRLIALDGTVNVVFEALQRNIHTYHESLSQSLSRMHNQGVQGEQLLVSIINDLIQQLQHQRATLNPSSDANKTKEPLEQPSSNSFLLTQENTLAIDNNHKTDVDLIEETEIAPEIEAMLQQLERETQTGIIEASVELQDNNSELRDEVDQLYASLFSNENLTDSSLDAPIQPTTEVTDAVDVSSASVELSDELLDAIRAETFEITFEATDELPAPTASQQQQPDSAIVMADPWFDEPDAGLLDLSNANVESHTLTPTAESLDLFNTLGLLGTQAIAPIEEPTSTDTITVLTDLLKDASNSPESQALVERESPEVPEYPHELVPDLEESSYLVSASAQTPEIINDYDELEGYEDNYQSANATENLLEHEENPDAASSVSLEEEQLQQLEQDLADFDRQLNSLLQPVTNTAEQANTETETTEVILEKLDSSLNNEINHIETENTVDSVWYLGLDLGTTGISASLLNRSTIELYPVYWSAENLTVASSTQSQRLPAEVYLPAEAIAQTEQIPVVATESVQPHNLFSAQLKPYLQICIPYKGEGQWAPVLQLNELSTVPLVWVVRSLAKLLLTLKSDRSSTTLGLTAAAIGLDQQTFHTIINNIAGVICTCPSNWSEQYRFNVREAILTSLLVQHPQQVFFVEEAIACLLSELDGANGEKVKLSTHEGVHSVKTSDRSLIGNTLIVSIGADTTEMGIVELPENLEDLTHSDFMLHGFAYAGKGIEQDIICQLLLPPKWRQSRTVVGGEDKNEQGNQRHWSPAIPGLDQMLLSSVEWSELNLPRPGEPDIADRIRLQQRLESSLLGKGVQEAAIAIKLILQHQDSFTLELADQQWVLQRRDLESQVFVPFVRRLNRELNRLLIAKGIPTEAINQALLTGGVASVGAVSRWLRQKLPNARMIQDALKSDSAPTCSRVAYGLAMLPLHPQVLEVPRQQYTDYFLFTELLQLLPERTISFGEIIQLFENRGINTRSCQQRLLAFLEGELPPGLIPSATDFTWLTQSSKENSDYQAISAAPLFEKQGSLNYRPNSHQLQHVLRYLDAIKASTQQSLSEPYTVNFAVGVVH